ncbi:MAG: pilus assembly protein [Burkholderiaceae bacterium]|nr:MAG: pilus assembly protein [Burkholderiaceae bacterium]
MARQLLHRLGHDHGRRFRRADRHPTYFVEYLGDTFPCSTNPDCSSQPCNCLRYRITARVGDAGRSQVMLQSVYATDP